MKKLEPSLLNAAFRFKILPNPEYEELLQRNHRIRDTTISNWSVTSVAQHSLKFQLFFRDIEAISEGGINFKDSLTVWIAEPEMLKFE